MNAKDLGAKSVSDLQKELNEQLETQFKLRMQKSTGQLNETHLVKQVRRDIARIKTVINQKVAAGE